MLNFIPRRNVGVNLLYGKRGLQRVEVGAMKRAVEFPVDVVDQIYKFLQPNVFLMNGDFQPLIWKHFMQLKLNACHLMEAAKEGGKSPKTSLRHLNWFTQLADIYSTNSRITNVKVHAALIPESNFVLKYPVQPK